MKNLPHKKTSPKRTNSPAASAPQHAARRKFFTIPEDKPKEPQVAFESRVRLGGVPLEKRAGFELLALRLKQLLHNNADAWETIDREEAGSFWLLFRKYHVPLLLPFVFFFFVHELVYFANTRLFVRHVAILLPMLFALYAGYIFLIGVIAEEIAEYSGGRFAPQSGMRVALFSTLIVSFLSVAIFLPVVGKPLLALGVIWHYRQLFCGARVLLHISEANYRLYKLSHLLVWILLGLAAFLLLSIVSFLSAKLGLAPI